jgi:hypothetical protein
MFILSYARPTNPTLLLQQQLEEAVLQALVDLIARDVCHQVCPYHA